MPELPEVETVVRSLVHQVSGARIVKAWTDWPRVLEPLSEPEFQLGIRGRRVQAMRRRGKYAILVLDQGFLVFHLRMTGRLYLTHRPRGEDAWVHLSLCFDDGRFLAFSDARKFGRAVLCRDLDAIEAKLGPEPLITEPEDLALRLLGGGRAIKAVLLDQKRIAGIGNIYADESLFEAGIHPERAACSLSDQERLSLAESVLSVLRRAITYEGATISWYRKPDGSKGESQKHFNVYGRKGEPCLHCGTVIERVVVAQRGTHYCPHCQPRPG